jgi:uroporphyrinogen decarboxylase
MTNRQRVIDSLNHKAPDKVPYDIGFTVKARAKMVEFYNDPQFDSKLDNCFSTLGTHKPGGGKVVTAGLWEDEFGVRWDKSIDRDIGNVCNSVVTPENFRECEFPNPDDPSRFSYYDAEIKKHPDQFVVADIGFSLFERAWTLAGMEPVLMGMIENPDYVHELLDRITDYNVKIIRHACDHNIDGMRFGDDWGQQTGLIMGAPLWREFIKPRLRQMYSAVKSKGKRVIIHCCGKVDEIFPDLIEIGVDVFNPFQPEVMDVYEMKRIHGHQLSFWGGISTQRTLPYGSVGQVKDEVRRLLDHIGKDGGYIAAPAHAIPGDAKPENVAAMIEVLNNQ